MNSVQKTFAGAMLDSGFTKKSGSWYLVSDETILVVELQKSNFGFAYFVNVAIWIRSLGEIRYPKEQSCHIRTRLGELLEDRDRLTELLKFEGLDSGAEDISELRIELMAAMQWIRACSSSISGLQSEKGVFLTSRSLVSGAAQRLLFAGR